ncbi:class I SAM-dependent methyltransferase [Pontiella sulfatireligans]|uniref:Methyltransferase type 11 domain-containing protein n=1 Tax=Pontiella sulfatireligans TaxID=2750658 RepID=A0A6C2UGB8_9BACT|nr:class I SAM-dependent methyltransferase [Pontiella sulfatireligans]VGO18256.1 hypothetical protein SCARR_00308 [Pontiella sulfatireligans]
MAVADIQVDRSLYFTSGYCLPGRFAAYTYQIKEVLDSGAKTVLEIGPGNGVATYVLRQAGIRVDTVDHDPALNPDFVASVVDLPFAQNSYDAVVCCQVLEHLPWDMFPDAMKGLASIAKEQVIISLPNATQYYYLNYKFPKLKQRSWAVERQRRGDMMEFDGEHYWEIGRGVSVEDLKAVFKGVGLAVQDSYRVPEYMAHHFFRLKPKNKCDDD